MKDSILGLFRYGSRVYGTNNSKSDYDYIMVVLDYDNDTPKYRESDYISFIANLEGIDASFVELTIYKESSFLSLLSKFDISIMECINLPKKDIVIPFNNFPYIGLNLWDLRTSISMKASNSWVKCKKKFIVPEDFNPYVGKKSAWHSLRILMFGIQIAKTGKIIDFTEANKYYEDIMNMHSWEEIDQKYKPVYNALSSELRQLCPKPILN